MSVSWAGFAWFIVIAVGGFTTFGYLSQTVAPSIATTFSWPVNPIVAMTLGWLLDSEPITWRMVMATAVIVDRCLRDRIHEIGSPGQDQASNDVRLWVWRVLLEPSPGN